MGCGHDALQVTGTHLMQNFCIGQSGNADLLHFLFTLGEPPECQPAALVFRPPGTPPPTERPEMPDPLARLPSPIPKTPRKLRRVKSTPSKPHSDHKSA